MGVSAEASALRARVGGTPSTRTLVRIEEFFASGSPRQKRVFQQTVADIFARKNPAAFFLRDSDGIMLRLLLLRLRHSRKLVQYKGKTYSYANISELYAAING